MSTKENPREIVRRALTQVYGNITKAERDRLEEADADCWLAQMNYGNSAQIKAQYSLEADILAIVEEMPEHRAKAIADYIRGQK